MIAMVVVPSIFIWEGPFNDGDDGDTVVVSGSSSMGHRRTMG